MTLLELYTRFKDCIGMEDHIEVLIVDDKGYEYEVSETDHNMDKEQDSFRLFMGPSKE